MLPSTALVFFRFLQRDIYHAQKRLSDIALNWGFLVPAMYVFMYGYLRPRVFLGVEHGQLDTVMFIGSILLGMQVLSYKASVSLLFDFLGNRYVDYQVTLLHPRLIIVERIVFATLYTFVMLIPYYLIAKLLLGDVFHTTEASWASVLVMLLVSSLAMSAFHVAVCCMVKSPPGLRKLWVRCNGPLALLGGFWVPLLPVMKAHPVIGYLSFLNPCIYSTEGLRSAFLQRPDFLPVSLCVGVLTLFSLLFTLLALYGFKKRMDHI
jgi:hypothetical protein